MKNIISRKVILVFNLLGNNIEYNIKLSLSEDLEGKCSSEGYIKKNTINIISYSAGIVESSNVIFDVVFDCLIYKPKKGMVFKCISKKY